MAALRFGCGSAALCNVLAVAALLIFHPATGTRAAEKAGLTDEEVRKIASAVPKKATARPAQPRKLLAFTLAIGYYHQSIPYGAKAIELMGEKTGAFQTTVSDDIAMFEPEKLRQFDGVCFVNALGELFLPQNLDKLAPAEQANARKFDERLKKGLVEFVKSGKGLAGIHGATYAFYQWPEFGEMLGAFFDNHPWQSTDLIAIKVDDPHHPVVAAFGGKGFEIIDEGYQFKDPYSRLNMRVLLSLDTARMDMRKEGLHRPDNDFGLSWVKRYGEGRVFYSALGHNPEEYWNPQILRHYLDGLQFALGDLPADTFSGGRRQNNLAANSGRQDSSVLEENLRSLRNFADSSIISMHFHEPAFGRGQPCPRDNLELADKAVRLLCWFKVTMRDFGFVEAFHEPRLCAALRLCEPQRF